MIPKTHYMLFKFLEFYFHLNLKSVLHKPQIISAIMPVEALIGSVISTLTPFLQQRLSPIFDASEELQKLSSSFTSIKALLNDAERKQVQNESLQVWLQELKDVAYEVDDMLDEWNTNKLIEEIKKNNCMNQVSNHSVRCLCSVCCFRVGQRVNGAVFAAQTRLFNLKTGISMGGRLKKIRQKLDMICLKRTTFGLTDIYGRNENDILRVETASLLNKSDPIFGRDAEKEEIISKLIHESSREDEDTRHTVLAIIGMGGLGKTTLAQATYNDERVKNHFDINIWVSIYEDFDVKKITLKILESAKVTTSDRESSLDLLQSRLQEVLNEKKFLLVMDDVWDDNQLIQKWEQLMIPLINGERRGSRVIITTRSQTVAKAMSSSYDFFLKELLDDHCWLLFKSRAFDGKEVEKHPDLEAIGRKMVKKLKGVPLYAKVVGGVMRCKRRKEEWEELLNNEIWETNEVANGIFPALLLSYYDLPSQLKQCFTFCSVFSKGETIWRSDIIKLWMAHGFLESNRRDLEETGERYLNDLVERSLLQNINKDEDYPQGFKFKLHDLLHDLAQYVGKHECSIFERTSLNPTSLTKCRHSTLILSEGDSSIFVTLPKANNLRTLLLFSAYKIDLDPVVAFDKLIFLRALYLSGSRIKKLDGSIGKLRHLRYLNLTCSDIEELPEELTGLCNLQTLNLCLCRKLSIVPQKISNLRSLRYFDVSLCDKLRHLPEGIGILSSLRHLRLKNVKHDMGIKMGELKELNNLLSLEMGGLEKVRDEEEAREAELKEKKQLQHLGLWWKDWSREELIRMGDDDMERMEEVLDALHPAPNLSILTIINFPGCRFPTWISMLTSCTQVTLSNCKKCKELPSLGLLPSLKYLSIYECDLVTHVFSTFHGMEIFPKLQCLDFRKMVKLEELELGEMPCLRQLYLRECPRLKTLPERLPPTLQTLALFECPLLKTLPERLPPTLLTLHIWACGNLSGQCKKEGGKYWPKIEHIPKIKIRYGDEIVLSGLTLFLTQDTF